MADITTILVEYWHIAIVAALLLLISIGFFLRFVFPALRLSGRDNSGHLLFHPLYDTYHCPDQPVHCPEP